MIYLASPYSDPSLAVMQQRYEAARHATAFLLCNRVWVYSPIVHCHELAIHHALPKDAVFWRDYNFAMLRVAEKLLILRIEGWEQSKGVAGEKAEAERLNIKWEYL